MKLLLFVLILFISIQTCTAWISTIHRKRFSLKQTKNDDGVWDESMTQQYDKNTLPSPTKVRENPCWQDIYDDDCPMSLIYSASFVAMDWIKDLPCAQGKVRLFI